MENKNTSTKTTSVATVFSGLGATSAACCAGPGIIGCSAVCAPTCGSLTYSLFGISSSAVATWLSDFWQLFLLMSIVFFVFSFYKIFISKSNACATTNRSKYIFSLCFLFSVVAYLYAYFSC